MPQFVLIHSPLVGPSSVVPTADALSTLGFATFVPTPNAPASLTRWREWPMRLLDALPGVEDPILVGHSAVDYWQRISRAPSTLRPLSVLMQ